jgi:hypothetical protein
MRITAGRRRESAAPTIDKDLAAGGAPTIDKGSLARRVCNCNGQRLASGESMHLHYKRERLATDG